MEKEEFFTNSKKDRASWIYEYNMWKNPGILFTTAKILLISAAAPALLIFFLSLDDGFLEALTMFGKIYGIIFGIVVGILFIAYPIICIMYGGKYIVLF